MNTHDTEIKLPPLPDIPAAICPWDHSEGVAKNLLQAYAIAAIEADRQVRGDPVALEYLRTHSHSIRGAFETLKGYTLLDEEDDPTYYDHEIRALDEALAVIEAAPLTAAESHGCHGGDGATLPTAAIEAAPANGPLKLEPLKYGGPDSDDYVTGWNDAIRALEINGRAVDGTEG